MTTAHHLAVQRTARYYTLEPTDDIQEVWFVLHGYGQLASYFIRSFESIQGKHRLIVAPEALSRFYLPDHNRVGASWMTKEDRLIEIGDYLAYLDGLYDTVFDTLDREAVRVHILGFSQGTATASRWAVLGRAHADRLLLWAGDLAHDLDLDAHADTIRRLDLTFVLGTDDEYITPERLDAQESLLHEHNLPYRLVRFDGGHRIEAEVLKEVAG